MRDEFTATQSPVATMAKPLAALTPISVAFVVSQNSWRSSSASRRRLNPAVADPLSLIPGRGSPVADQH